MLTIFVDFLFDNEDYLIWIDPRRYHVYDWFHHQPWIKKKLNIYKRFIIKNNLLVWMFSNNVYLDERDIKKILITGGKEILPWYEIIWVLSGSTNSNVNESFEERIGSRYVLVKGFDILIIFCGICCCLVVASCFFGDEDEKIISFDWINWFIIFWNIFSFDGIFNMLKLCLTISYVFVSRRIFDDDCWIWESVKVKRRPSNRSAIFDEDKDEEYEVKFNARRCWNWIINWENIEL